MMKRNRHDFWKNGWELKKRNQNTFRKLNNNTPRRA